MLLHLSKTAKAVLFSLIAIALSTLLLSRLPSSVLQDVVGIETSFA